MPPVVNAPHAPAGTAEVKPVAGGQRRAPGPAPPAGIVIHPQAAGGGVQNLDFGVVGGDDRLAVNQGRRRDYPVIQAVIPEGFAGGGVQRQQAAAVGFRHEQTPVGHPRRGQRRHRQPAAPDHSAGSGVQRGYYARLEHHKDQPVRHRRRNGGRLPGIVAPELCPRIPRQGHDPAVLGGQINPVAHHGRRGHDGRAGHIFPNLRRRRVNPDATPGARRCRRGAGDAAPRLRPVPGRRCRRGAADIR